MRHATPEIRQLSARLAIAIDNIVFLDDRHIFDDAAAAAFQPFSLFSAIESYFS